MASCPREGEEMYPPKRLRRKRGLWWEERRGLDRAHAFRDVPNPDNLLTKREN